MTTLPPDTIVIRVEDMTLDRLCFEYAFRLLGDRRRAGTLPGYLPAVLKANPGLAGLGTTLPLGTKVALPLFTVEQESPNVRRLWD